jgi:hypothetical protein
MKSCLAAGDFVERLALRALRDCFISLFEVLCVAVFALEELALVRDNFLFAHTNIVIHP